MLLHKPNALFYAAYHIAGSRNFLTVQWDLSYKNTLSLQHVQYEKHHQLFIFSQYLIS